MSFISSVLLSSLLSLNVVGVPLVQNNNMTKSTNIDVYTPPENSQSNPDKDGYEMNDSFSFATYIAPSNYYSSDSYSVQLEATLDYTGQIQDIDYYYFVVLTDSYIEFSVTPDNYTIDYDFGLLTNDYSLFYNDGNENMDHILSNVYYTTTHSNISYSGFLEPGTYYFYLRGWQTTNTILNYELEYTITKATQYYTDANIEDLKEAGLKGAVWVSDYVPIKDFNLLNIHKEYIYYDSSDSHLQYPEYAIDHLNTISNGNGVRMANYYIWDPILKYVLAKSFYELENYFVDTIIGELIEIQELQIIYNTIGEVINIAFKIAGEIVERAIEIPIGGIIETVGGFFSDFVVDILYSTIPVFEISKVYLVSYFATLKGDLNLDDVSMSEYLSYQEVLLSEDDSVVEIPIFYSSYYENNIKILTFNDSYITTVQTFNYISDSITSSQSNDYYCRGKVYAIEDYSDLNDITNLKLCSMLANNQPNLNTHQHDYTDSYIWYNRTQHKANCGCGHSLNQGHIVRNGTKICILCGGIADIGFVIGPNSKNYVTETGSYILPNGVIVLSNDDYESLVKTGRRDK